ncbi:MAG: hypothetical protein LBK01_09180 [Burkholderiaceae bacterium]|nr:hypothetical protein [Burkholderiaceae bacterium]
MKRLVVLCVSSVVLAGCAVFADPPQPGESGEAVIARMGKPTAQYQDGETTLLEYAHSYWGQETWMVRLDRSGRVLSYEQVLTSPGFAELVIGKSTQRDVLLKFGQPGWISRIYKNNYLVWEYHYKQDEVWPAVMYIMFDKNGVVQHMENGLDLMYYSAD